MEQAFVTLNNGIKMPQFGIGTYLLTPEEAEKSTLAALQEKVFADLAAKYHKTPAQIILRWHILMGFIVIPGSKNPDHVRENFNIFDFALTDDEMGEIAKLNKNVRYYNRTDEQLVQFAAFKPHYED